MIPFAGYKFQSHIPQPGFNSYKSIRYNMGFIKNTGMFFRIGGQTTKFIFQQTIQRIYTFIIQISINTSIFI